MLTDDWMRRRWLEACDSTAIPLGAFKTIARAIEAEISAKAGKSPVARVREHGDFQATVDWLLNPLPDGTELFDDPVDCQKCDEWRASEHKLSDAYLRIRQKLNAFDTPHGPTADQVYERTEAAIDAMQAKVAILDGLSQDAIDGGWTYRGMNAYAVGLEAKIAELEQKATRARLDADMYANAWQRELCAFDGKIYNKRHHIDAMVVTTQRFVEAWKQAIRTLTSAGYTLNDGAQEWKPPVGPSASPLLDKIDAQSALIEKCREALINHRYLTRPIQQTDEALAAIEAQKGGAE